MIGNYGTLNKLNKKFVSIQSNVPGAQAFRYRSCTILVSEDPVGWHLSISHPSRYPKWDEIKEARYALLPKNVTMAFFLPGEGDYVNLHKNCFHLFEVKEHEKPKIFTG